MSNISDLQKQVANIKMELQKMRFTPIDSRKKDHINVLRGHKKAIAKLKKDIHNLIFEKKVEQLKEKL